MLCLSIFPPPIQKFKQHLRKALSIFSKLSNHLAANYHSFGIQLGFTLNEISSFAKHKVPVKDKLESMLNEWVLANKPLSDVYTALESGAVGQNRLANDLREEWSK